MVSLVEERRVVTKKPLAGVGVGIYGDLREIEYKGKKGREVVVLGDGGEVDGGVRLLTAVLDG